MSHRLAVTFWGLAAIFALAAACSSPTAARPTPRPTGRRATAPVVTQSRPTEAPWTSTPARRATATPISTATPHAVIGVKGARSVAFHPNGQWLALGTEDGHVVIWDVRTNSEKCRMKEHSASVGSVAFSADGSLLASASADKTAIVWEAATGKVLHRLKEHTGEVTDVAFADYGAWLFTAGLDGYVWMWDASKGSTVAYVKGSSGALGIAYSHTRLLAVAREDGTVIIADWPAQKDKYVLRAFPDIQSGQTAYRLAYPRLDFSPDGHLLACPALILQPGGTPGKAYVSDMRDGKNETELPGNPRATVFGPDGAYLALGHLSGAIEIWDVTTWAKVLTLPGAGAIWDLAFSPDKRWLVSVGASGTQLWALPGR